MADPTVLTLTRACFDAAARLRAHAGGPAGPEVQERVRGIVDAFMADARAARLDQRDIQDIAYAIVALLDETVGAQPGPMRDAWLARPLQVQMFAENTAGDGFFRRLGDARADPARADVLLVYYLCLQYGFQGRYSIRGERELADLTARVAEELFPPADEPRPLAPDALPSDAVDRGRRGASPVWAALALVLVALVVYVALRLRVTGDAEALVRDIDALAIDLDRHAEVDP